jgi:SAM-dependent methyltransferase
LFVRYARNQAEDETTAFFAGDAGHLSLRSKSYDLVVSSAFIEHVPDVQLCIAEMGRVLRVGGYAIIVGPNLLSPYLALKRVLQRGLGRPVSPLWGINMRESVATLGHSLTWTIRKQFFNDGTLLYRDPTPCHDQILADADATWWSNPHDLGLCFSGSGFRVVQLALAPKGIGRILDRVFAGMMPSIRLVARKM